MLRRLTLLLLPLATTAGRAWTLHQLSSPVEQPRACGRDALFSIFQCFFGLRARPCAHVLQFCSSERCLLFFFHGREARRDCNFALLQQRVRLVAMLGEFLQ